MITPSNILQVENQIQKIEYSVNEPTRAMFQRYFSCFAGCPLGVSFMTVALFQGHQHFYGVYLLGRQCGLFSCDAFALNDYSCPGAKVGEDCDPVVEECAATRPAKAQD